jgi:hypothetical protein
MNTSPHDPLLALMNPLLLATDILMPVEPPSVTPKTNPFMTPPTAADTADSPILVHVTYTASDPFIVNKFPVLLPPVEPPPVTPTTSPMTMPHPAADTEDYHHLIHFSSTAFLSPHQMDDTYTANDLFSPGSMFCCLIIDQPLSPSSILYFTDTHLDFHSDITLVITLAMDLSPPVLDSITQICRQSRVFGFNDCHFVQCMLASNRYLMDSGANICITNSLAHLIDAVDITPFTFSLKRNGTMHSVDNCCTKCSLLPLAMTDGSLYYQSCYYCKNTTETIISPQAVVDASDTLLLGIRQDTNAASRVLCGLRVRVVFCQ